MRISKLIAGFVLAFAPTGQAGEQSGPLPSWNDTVTKSAIIGFVTKVPQTDGGDFAPPQQPLNALGAIHEAD